MGGGVRRALGSPRSGIRVFGALTVGFTHGYARFAPPGLHLLTRRSAWRAFENLAKTLH